MVIKLNVMQTVFGKGSKQFSAQCGLCRQATVERFQTDVSTSFVAWRSFCDRVVSTRLRYALVNAVFFSTYVKLEAHTRTHTDFVILGFLIWFPGHAKVCLEFF